MFASFAIISWTVVKTCERAMLHHVNITEQYIMKNLLPGAWLKCSFMSCTKKLSNLVFACRTCEFNFNSVLTKVKIKLFMYFLVFGH